MADAVCNNTVPFVVELVVFVVSISVAGFQYRDSEESNFVLRGDFGYLRHLTLVVLALIGSILTDDGCPGNDDSSCHMNHFDDRFLNKHNIFNVS